MQKHFAPKLKPCPRFGATLRARPPDQPAVHPRHLGRDAASRSIKELLTLDSLDAFQTALARTSPFGLE